MHVHLAVRHLRMEDRRPPSAGYFHYVVYPPGVLETPRIRAFRDRIIEEAGAPSRTVT